MPDRKIRLTVLGLFILAAVVGAFIYLRGGEAKLSVDAVTGPTPKLESPTRRLIPVLNVPRAVGWQDGETPTAAKGLAVTRFAGDLDHPRWIHVLPNGDILVAETNGPEQDAGGVRGMVMGWLKDRSGSGRPSANRITLLRDTDGDGVADQRSVLLQGLNSPLGMAATDGWLYVANTDALVRYPFKPGQTSINAPAEKILDLPSGPGHWTRDVVASPDGKLLYVSVGSASNIGELGMDIEKNRAAVLEVDPEARTFRIFAGGLRNPVGLDWEPVSNTLWGVVNERDEIGSDLVPDYLTQVQFGGFYGWPWYYWGGYTDARVPKPAEDMRQYTNRPDYALGPHVAALGLAFAGDAKLGDQFANGAFIGQHGSWNRRPLSGYKVVFVPFAKGRPAGKPVDVLTGFLDDNDRARGRPAGVAIDGKGALLVADDAGNSIWRVSAAKP